MLSYHSLLIIQDDGDNDSDIQDDDDIRNVMIDIHDDNVHDDDEFWT